MIDILKIQFYNLVYNMQIMKIFSLMKILQRQVIFDERTVCYRRSKSINESGLS